MHFFETMAGTIICIISIQKTLKSIENKETNNYTFADVPIQREYHWFISEERVILDSPLKGYSDWLGLVEIKDNSICDSLSDILQNYHSQKNDLDIYEKIHDTTGLSICALSHLINVAMIFKSEDIMSIVNKRRFKKQVMTKLDDKQQIEYAIYCLNN
eukprot:230767_1